MASASNGFSRLTCKKNPIKSQCLPHPRGGVSISVNDLREGMASSPPAWGVFLGAEKPPRYSGSLPTRVGVFLVLLLFLVVLVCLPHPRGGVSSFGRITGDEVGSSPPAWGCFQCSAPRRSDANVFPTRVGVFLSNRTFALFIMCLPHPRGGVSGIRWKVADAKASSPPAWGCFSEKPMSHAVTTVFPTRVGVFLPKRLQRRSARRLPHPRGGCFSLYKDSPKYRGVFPTRCGGVS